MHPRTLGHLAAAGWDSQSNSHLAAALSSGYSRSDNILLSSSLLSSSSPISPLFHVGKLVSMRPSRLKVRCSAESFNLQLEFRTLPLCLSDSLTLNTKYAPKLN